MTFEEWAKGNCVYDVERGFARRVWQAAQAAAQAAEREACAKVCDGLGNQPGWSYATKACADEIRARAIQWDEDRMDLFSQHGNDGLHYDQEK